MDSVTAADELVEAAERYERKLDAERWRKCVGKAVCACGRRYDIVAYSEKSAGLVEHVDTLPKDIIIRKWFEPGTFETVNGELAAQISRSCDGLWTSSGRTVICNGVEYSVVLYYSGEEFWTRKGSEDG